MASSTDLPPLYNLYILRCNIFVPRPRPVRKEKQVIMLKTLIKNKFHILSKKLNNIFKTEFWIRILLIILDFFFFATNFKKSINSLINFRSFGNN